MRDLTDKNEMQNKQIDKLKNENKQFLEVVFQREDELNEVIKTQHEHIEVY